MDRLGTVYRIIVGQPLRSQAGKYEWVGIVVGRPLRPKAGKHEWVEGLRNTWSLLLYGAVEFNQSQRELKLPKDKVATEC